MIDELSLGLAPTIVAQLLDVVREIHRRGTTIVIVEQSVNVALTLAERAVFMEKGEVRFEGPTAELLERPDILRSVFIAGASGLAAEPSTNGKSNGHKPATSRRRRAGGGHHRTRPRIDPDAKVVLECDGVVKRFGGIIAVDEVDLQVREGRDRRPHRPQRRRQDHAHGLHLRASSRSTGAASGCAASTSPTGPRTSGPKALWGGRSRTPCCSRP